MPAAPNSNPYLYFMYSTEHVDKRNDVESEHGKRFECGNVVVSGKRQKFSFLARTTTMRNSFVKDYPDAKIIAEGYKNKVTYTDCRTMQKRSN